MLLKPCPFCEGANVETRSFASEGPDHYVHCMGCGASGPLGEDAWEAAKMWNHRVDEVALMVLANDAYAVHINLLRRSLARPSVSQIIHIYGIEALEKGIRETAERMAANTTKKDP